MNFSKLATTILTTATVIAGMIPNLPAFAGPVNGVFSIQTRKGNFVDVYGNSFKPHGDKSPAAVHLWNQKLNTNNFILGPDENTGNEIRVADDQNICVTPKAPLGSRPAAGTPVVAIRDCANSWNWKRVGNNWVIGRHMDLCLDIAWGNDTQGSLMQVVNCTAGNPAQQFGTGQGSVVIQPPVVNNPYVPPVVVPQNTTPPRTGVVILGTKTKPDFGPTNTTQLGTSGSNDTGAKKYMGVAWNMAKNSATCFAAETSLFKGVKLPAGKAIKIFNLNFNFNSLLFKGVCALALPGGGFSSQSNLMPVYHVYPDNLAVEWNEASDHCVATYSAPHRPVWLTWNENLKKCVGQS